MIYLENYNNYAYCQQAYDDMEDPMSEFNRLDEERRMHEEELLQLFESFVQHSIKEGYAIKPAPNLKKLIRGTSGTFLDILGRDVKVSVGWYNNTITSATLNHYGDIVHLIEDNSSIEEAQDILDYQYESLQRIS